MLSMRVADSRAYPQKDLGGVSRDTIVEVNLRGLLELGKRDLSVDEYL
ncbi:hypothetical protein Tco_1223559, partial [Tanacetum coccineum]